MELAVVGKLMVKVPFAQELGDVGIGTLLRGDLCTIGQGIGVSTVGIGETPAEAAPGSINP